MKTFALLVLALICAATLSMSDALAQSPASATDNQKPEQSAIEPRLTLRLRTNIPKVTHAKVQSISTAATQVPVTGTGTPGKLTKWLGFSDTSFTIGDSEIIEDKFRNVGIGTATPTSKFTVAGMIQTTIGGIKFPDGTVQTTSANGSLFTVAHDATLNGNGTSGAPLGVAVPLSLIGSLNSPVITGDNRGTGVGVLGFGGAGVQGVGGLIGVSGQGGAVSGFSTGGLGVGASGGEAPEGIGGTGLLGRGGDGIAGGQGVQAVGGDSTTTQGQGTGGAGLNAFGGTGSGQSASGGDGIVALAGEGINGAIKGVAARLRGAVLVTDSCGPCTDGNLNVARNLNVSGTKNFRIDHPLDPENKYLYHAAIESSEVLNVYSGNITTDSNGDAVVELPDWFEAINKDFRYQLTVVGQFAQAIVADKIHGNRFGIRTSVPDVEVSWQITGVRSDPVMRKHPFRVEEVKPEQERGLYLSPDAFDQPQDKGIDAARARRSKQIGPVTEKAAARD